MKKQVVGSVMLVSFVFAVGYLLGFHQSVVGQEATASVTPTPVSMQPYTPPVTDLLFDATPGPDVPTLHELAIGADEDAQIVEQVVSYFQDNRERLQELWREDNPTRLAGLFSMYVVHISHVYGETTYPSSFAEYLAQPRAHCGTYSIAQSKIADGLGLTWRMWELTSGWHGWIEILVDDQWEIFDATTNTWINRSGLELLERVPREYRTFYTPLLDIDQPDARLHLNEGYNMQRFRAEFVGLGLYYNPPGEPFLSDRPDLWSEPQIVNDNSAS